MNTFLPYRDFSRSAKVLDDKRLGKQRVEVVQILRALRGLTKGWQNHPAVRMWRDYEDALGMYGLAMCAEWKTRGFKDSCAAKIVMLSGYTPGTVAVGPSWLGLPEFHLGQQSNLLRKNPEHYGVYFSWVPDDLPYFWPTPNNWRNGPTLGDGTYQKIQAYIERAGLVEWEGNFMAMVGHPANR